MNTELPVVVIGAGPVGLAAAAHLLGRGLKPLVLEAGERVGAGMLRWKHVRMFSPWEFNIDRAAGALLAKHGWRAPDLSLFPTGGEVVAEYLQPLAALPGIAPHVRVAAHVVKVARQHRDRMQDTRRNEVPYLVRYLDASGEQEVLAQAVIDASGTIGTPNPLGASGIPAIGERALREHIFYGMPDIMGEHRSRYADKRVLVVGSGHSAFNVLSDLARLSRQAPGTQIHWAIRRPSLRRVLGGGEHDQLKQRGRLGILVGNLVEEGVLQVATGFHLDRLERTSDGIAAYGEGKALPPVDEIVAVTGFRPDLGVLSELRIALDQGTQAPVALAPLIDPNLHSCGSVRPHGAEELKHPDGNVYIVGMKSYGRAPTFLLLTGYEQVRSVVAAIAGDWKAARRVELVLPETGVCITQFAEEDVAEAGISSTCCGQKAAEEAVPAFGTACCCGPASAVAGACCVQTAETNVARKHGCGCVSTDALVEPARACCNA